MQQTNVFFKRRFHLLQNVWMQFENSQKSVGLDVGGFRLFAGQLLKQICYDVVQRCTAACADHRVYTETQTQ